MSEAIGNCIGSITEERCADRVRYMISQTNDAPAVEIDSIRLHYHAGTDNIELKVLLDAANSSIVIELFGAPGEIPRDIGMRWY